jgi:xanthine/CO dehydrogenase XdhC/CoxF family maturation factor
VIDVLLEPLPPARGKYLAKLLDKALKADKPSVLATIITEKKTEGATSVGAHALIIGNTIEKTGGWGSELLAKATSDTEEVLNAGRRGLVRDFNGVEVAYEVVSPAIALVICGGGPDVQPIARIAADLGWNVTVVDHRQVTDSHTTRYPGARVIECADADKLAECITLTKHTAGVVMSHNLSRDTAYVESFLKGGVAYIGVLGPRARTERMLADLAARGGGEIPNGDKIFAPVGMDLGSEGPDAIALAIIAEISAVMHKRQGGHLRDRKGPLHAQAQTN